MRKVRLVILKVILAVIIFMAVFYALFLYALPPVLNSSKVRFKAERLLKEKTNLDLITKHLYFRTHPDLSISINADKIYLENKDKKPVFKTDNISAYFNLPELKFKNIYTDYVYLDEFELKSLIKSNQTKSHNKVFNIDTSYIPNIIIKNAEIWIDKESINSIFIVIDDFNIIKAKHMKVYCTFKADIISAMLKNLIHIGDGGCLYIENNNIYAKDLKIKVGYPDIKINGLISNKNRENDFTIKGDNLPVNDIESSLLYFLKLRKKGKQFLENFKDFNGNIDINLNVKNWGFYGMCFADDLEAKSVLFDVPVKFKKVFFKFNNREVTSKAIGTLGGEKVFNTFKMTDMATDLQEVTGHINSFITNKLASEYLDNSSVTGGMDASVDYRVKDHKIYVDYMLNIKKGSAFIYKKSFIGITNKDRRILVKTLKDNDELYIRHYDYSTIENNKVKNIVLGTGLFKKKDNHFTPEYITCATNGFVPVTIAGSFGQVIDGGVFSGDIKYIFKKNLVTGNFTVKDTAYKNFYVNTAKILADENKIRIEANGDFKNSPYECTFDAKNDITDKIHIYNMYLMLEEYIINPALSKKTKISKKVVNKIKNKAKELDITIDKWTVKINKIQRNKFELKNIMLTGSLKNNVFKFLMPHTEFSDGILCANGVYNINNLSSEINFSAHKINSNKAADIFFNLKDQIEGIADASLNLKSNNNFKDIQGLITFKVEQGYLPKLGSTEFIIKKSKKIKRELKFKISDIINIDIKNMKALASDINGSLYIDNAEIKDIEITSRQKYLSLLIEGDYNADSCEADLNLYGKYSNKAQKKIKILFIPLSWIVNIIFKPEHTFDKYINEINRIPSIQAQQNDENTFRVKLKGNLNSDNIDVELKRIIKNH